MSFTTFELPPFQEHTYELVTEHSTKCMGCTTWMISGIADNFLVTSPKAAKHHKQVLHQVVLPQMAGNQKHWNLSDPGTGTQKLADKLENYICIALLKETMFDATHPMICYDLHLLCNLFCAVQPGGKQMYEMLAGYLFAGSRR
eukprot:5245846-Amphidinium_carterae.1